MTLRTSWTSARPLPSRLAIVLAFLIAAAQAGAPVAAAGQAPGPPDPARLPSRPGLPGAGPAGAPPRDPSARRTPETGTAVVRGRVVALDTGLPLRRARVQLYSSSEPRVVTTDAEGTFVFDQLPAGRYDLRASKARYVDTGYGVRRPGGPGRMLELVEGQSVDNAVLALPPAGVITGRVVDEAGEVVTGAMVAPMRYRTIDGERQLTPFGQMRTTDDTGTFRLYGLAPGKYYLSARGDESQRFGGNLVDPNATGFAPTYFPGTAAASEAQPIEVVAGAEVLADVQLVTTRLTTVAGVVVDAAGAPATGGHIMVMGSSGGGGRFMSGGAGGGIRPDGTFTVSGLAPGEYTLVAQASFGAEPMFDTADRGDRLKAASAPIVAGGAPVTGLRLVVQDPVRIPVNVTFEDGSASQPDKVFISANRERGIGGAQATLRDGRLSLEVVPGTYRLTAASMSSHPWFVKRISYRGREIEDDEVELTAEPGGRIDVVFTGRSSAVSGAVTDESGKAVTESMVIIVPEGTEPRRVSWQHLRVVRTDAQGRFREPHLRPGRYVAAALDDAPIDDIQDVDFLDAVRRQGKPFTVAEGGSATLALTLTRLP